MDITKENKMYHTTTSQPEEKTNTTCNTCNTGEHADVFCLDCKEHLCHSCHTSHQAFKAMKHHKVVSIEGLRSGKVVPLSGIDIEDQHCNVHDGEIKRFYCETCVKLVCRDCVVVKQCCRDHRYVTLSEAANKHTKSLTKLLDKSKEKEKECQDAIRETEKVEEDFKNAARAYREAVGKMRGEYIKMLEQIFTQQENDLKIIEVEKAQELYGIKTDLLSKLDQMKSAIELVTTVTQMGTEYDIVSKFTSLSQDLERLIRSQPIPADDSLGQIQIKIPLIYFHSTKPWKHVGKFTTKPWVYYPLGITIHPDGDIAVASPRNVQVFSRAGGLLYSFKAASCDQVIVTPDKKYLLNALDGLSCFDFPNKQKSAIQILDDTKQSINPVSLGVDPNGQIIAASGSSNGSHATWFGLISSMILTSSQEEPQISIHQPDGSFIRSFKPTAYPRHIAMTSDKDIIATLDNDSLQLMDYSGNNIRILAPPHDVQKWLPQNVCCDKNNLFVVNAGEPLAVYRYTISGIYLGLVALLENFQPPVDIAISPDGTELFALDKKAGCVQIYKE
ncbi:uncharacterized protein [Amphiura filiformis]|uniref:uncharacterized protein n=1 Tax=Amphiura filiformis TaxID=82378 RepID=UPI003B2172D5